jgi:hypothetical protein
VKFEMRRSRPQDQRIVAHKGRVSAGMPRAIAQTVTMVAVGAIVFGAGSSAAAPVPPQGPIVSFQMLVSGPDGRNVFDIRGKPKDPTNVTPPLFSRGTMKISPKLCERDYQLDFSFYRPSGYVGGQLYDAKVHGARLDGRPRHCPYAGLPRRGLRSFHVLVTIKGEKLMTFNAIPRTGAGETFNTVSIATLRYYAFTTISGLARIRVRARYRTGRDHVATIRADIAAARTVPKEAS